MHCLYISIGIHYYSCTCWKMGWYIHACVDNFSRVSVQFNISWKVGCSVHPSPLPFLYLLPWTWIQLSFSTTIYYKNYFNHNLSLSLFQCNRSIALESLFKQLTSDPIKLGWIGSGCSVATEPTAEITQYFHIPQVECWMHSQLYEMLYILEKLWSKWNSALDWYIWSLI